MQNERRQKESARSDWRNRSWPRCPAGVLFTFRNKTRPSELTPSRSLQLAFSWESQITYLVYIILSVTAY
jgi:hypothetical protein